MKLSKALAFVGWANLYALLWVWLLKGDSLNNNTVFWTFVFFALVASICSGIQGGKNE